jgi:hypothetical protein
VEAYDIKREPLFNVTTAASTTMYDDTDNDEDTEAEDDAGVDPNAELRMLPWLGWPPPLKGDLEEDRGLHDQGGRVPLPFFDCNYPRWREYYTRFRRNYPWPIYMEKFAFFEKMQRTFAFLFIEKIGFSDQKGKNSVYLPGPGQYNSKPCGSYPDPLYCLIFDPIDQVTDGRSCIVEDVVVLVFPDHPRSE